MVTYPIKIKPYRDTDEGLHGKSESLNRIAKVLERNINAKLKAQTKPIEYYLYSAISEETGYSIDTVQEVCFSIDGGSHGFTGYRYGLTQQEAVDEQELEEGRPHIRLQ